MISSVFSSAVPLVGEVNGVPSMSVDGRHVAWLSSGDSAPRLVLFDVDRRCERGHVEAKISRAQAFAWSHLPNVGVAVADRNGDENWTLYRVRVETGDWTPLGEPCGAQTRVVGLSTQRPQEVLVATNKRDPQHHDYDVSSLGTGERTRLLENVGYSAVYFDEWFRPRLVETVNTDGSRELWHGDPRRGKLFLRVPHEEALCVRFMHFSADGYIAYFVLPDGPAGMRLVGLCCGDDTPAMLVETVFAVRRADITQVLSAPSTARPELVEVEQFRRRTVALRPSLEPSLRALRRRLGGEPTILERRLDDRYWLVAERRPDLDGRYFVYEPHRDELWPLSATRPGRGRLPIVCRVADVPLRDGQQAVTYLTRPNVDRLKRGRGADNDLPPAVLLVHGGPWRRSRWEYSERRAWLATQGFTVIEPNFRGSTGFGAAWVNAADRQWGAAMQDDLEDTLDWAVRQGYADPARIALVGGSYGGYAVLQLAATSRRRFRCVVAISPVTDLVAFTEELPAYWHTAAPMVRHRVGDPADAAQRRALTEMSPLHHAAAVRCPVLLVHGLNDTRVPVKMSTRMFMALARGNRDALLALLSDEGHDIVNTGNRLACDALLATFLARHVRGEDLPYLTSGTTTMKLLYTPRAELAQSRVAKAGSV
jgi:acetyl esterase/lipase